MIQFFTIVFNIFRKNRFLFSLFLVIMVGLMVLLATRLTFVEDIYKVVPADKKVGKFTQVLKHSSFSDQMVMYITSSDEQIPVSPEELIRFAEILEDSLRNSLYPDYIKGIRIKTDDSLFFEVYDEIFENLPLFLSEDDYVTLDEDTQPGSIDDKVFSAYKSLLSPAGFATREFILKDPLGITSLATNKIRDLQVDESYSIFNGYIFSSDRRYLMVFLTPAHPSTETAANSLLMDRLDEIIQRVSGYFDQNITAEYFGSAAISVSNARQIKRDILLTMSLAAIVLTIFILAFFRRKLYFLAVFFPAVLGGGFAMALLYLIRTEVSAISLGLVPFYWVSRWTMRCIFSMS